MNTYVNTVRGPMPIDDIGVTLTHEHLHKNSTMIYNKQFPKTLNMSDEPITRENRDEIWADKEKILYQYRDNLVLTDVDEMVEELKGFTAAGGNTIFDVTPDDLGRNPEKLREISEKSGVNIVMGSAHYYLPMIEPDLYERVVHGDNGAHILADRIIREFYDGVGDTGIKPGVLGEVGLRHIPQTDEILARATLIAQKETGAPVIYHYAPFYVLDMAEEIGADPTKIVMGHWTMERRVDEAVERGAWIAFDQFGMDFPGIINDEQRADEVLAMFEKGYEKHLLLSMDICWKVRFAKNGGGGFANIFENGLPLIKQRGITDEQIRSLLVDNPQRLLR